MAPLPEADAAVRWLTEHEQRAWRAYLSGTRRLLDGLERDLKTHGLTHDDYGVLVALSESEGGRLRMADLADQSVESRSRLSHHISRLEARGLVTREICPSDRRGAFAVLTPQGRATIEDVAPHHVAGVREYLLDQVSASELATIGAVFNRINQKLGPGAACGDDVCPDAAGTDA